MIIKSYSLNTVQFNQDTERPEVVIITAEDSQLWVRGQVGRFNFYTKEGSLVLPNGQRKEYKQFKAILNAFFKLDEMFGYTINDINKAQEAAKDMIKQDNKARKAEQYKKDQDKYDLLVSKINNDDSFVESFRNKTDEEIQRLADNTFKHDKSLATKIFNLIISKLNEEDNKQTEQRNYRPSYNNISFNEEAITNNRHYDRFNEYKSEYLVSEARKQVRRINDFKGEDVETYVTKLEMLLYILKERNYINYDLKDPIQTLEDIQRECIAKNEKPITVESVNVEQTNVNELNNEDNNNNTVESVLYWYSYRLRGFSPFCQPKGHIEHNPTIGRYGIIAYNRELTAYELDEYELLPYNSEDMAS